MPDISMCSISEDKCSKALFCYRRMVKPNPHWQSYSLFTGDANKKGCRGYIALEPTKELTNKPKRKAK